MQITAVDQDYGCIKFINKTIDEFEMQIQVIRSDVYKYLEHAKQKATIIFADPPYAFTDEQFARIPELIFKNDLLEKDGMFILEHSKHTDLSKLQHYSSSKNYGGSVFSFFINQ
jgi:16S rRNA G966 N2-methylase RsmD